MIQRRENGDAWNTMPYEWKSGSVNVAGTTPTARLGDQANWTTLFDTVSRAHKIVIESTGTLYVRLNDTSADIITVTATSPLESDVCVVRDIYVASNGAPVTVTVKLNI